MKRFKHIAYVMAIVLVFPFTLFGCNKIEPTLEHTVTFHKNTTAEAAFMPDSVKVVAGERVKRPIKVPTRVGYTFVDWYTSGQAQEPYNFSSAINKNTTIYAGWEENVESIKPLQEREVIETTEDINDEFFNESSWEHLVKENGDSDEGQPAVSLSDKSIRFFRTNLTTDVFTHDITSSTTQISFMVNATKDFSIRFGAKDDTGYASSVVLAHKNNQLQIRLTGRERGLVEPDYETGALARESDDASGYTPCEWNRIDLVFANEGQNTTLRLYVNMRKTELVGGERLAGVSVEQGNFVYSRVDGAVEFGGNVSVKTWARDSVLSLKAVKNSQTESPIRVACIGDSITEGAGASNFYAGGYPQRLQQKLGEGFSVVNFGVSGRTAINLPEIEESAWEGSYRKNVKGEPWQGNVYSGVKLFRPDIVIVMLGTNDSKPKYNTTSGEFKQALSEIINGVKAVNESVRVVVNTSPTAYENGFEIDPSVVQEMAVAVQKELAEENGYTLVDINKYTYNKKRVFFAADGVHPNDDGYEMISEIMKRVVLEENCSSNELQAVSDSYIEPTPQDDIETTKDFSAEFYQTSGWSGTLPTTSEGVLSFSNGEARKEIGTPTLGEVTQYSFLIKADAAEFNGSYRWEIRFSLNQSGSAFYSLNQRYGSLYLDANGGQWVSEVRADEAGYLFNEWNRVDILIDKTGTYSRVIVFINGVHAFVVNDNETNLPSGITVEQGVLVDRNNISGTFIEVRVDGNNVLIAPTTQLDVAD